MALGDGTGWDETNPTNSSNASDIDDYNRDLRKGVRIRMEYEHSTFAGSSGGGKHTYITLQEQASKPTVDATQVCALYVKDDGDSDNDLFFERADGAEMQLTDGDFLNPEMADYWEFANQSSAPSTAANKSAIYTKDVGGQPELYWREESDGDEVQLTSGGSVNGGAIVQVVNTQDGEVNSGATAIPFDNTIPQNDEGDEYMTLAVTPTASANKLKIDVVIHLEGGTSDVTAALFQDSTADALAAITEQLSGLQPVKEIKFTHFMAAGTTSATTFKVRAGSSSGTVTFNGKTAGRLMGGVMASSITITEIKV